MGDKKDDADDVEDKRSGSPLRNLQKSHLEKLMANPVRQAIPSLACMLNCVLCLVGQTCSHSRETRRLETQRGSGVCTFLYGYVNYGYLKLWVLI